MYRSGMAAGTVKMPEAKGAILACHALAREWDSPEDAEYFADNAHMIRLPVCIISHDEIALEAALMEYNGRAFVDLQSELPDSELYTLARGYLMAKNEDGKLLQLKETQA